MYTITLGGHSACYTSQGTTVAESNTACVYSLWHVVLCDADHVYVKGCYLFVVDSLNGLTTLQ